MFGFEEIDVDTNIQRERMARSRSLPTPPPQNRYRQLPEDWDYSSWEPTGVLRSANESSSTEPIWVNPPIQAEAEMPFPYVNQGAVRRFIPPPTRTRPPRHIDSQTRKEEEEEENYQMGLSYLRAKEAEIEEELEAIRRHSRSATRKLIEERRMIKEEKSRLEENRRQYYRSKLVKAANRRMPCQRCGDTSHREQDCSQTE